METTNQNLFQLLIKHQAAADCIRFAMKTKDEECKKIALDNYDSFLSDINEMHIPEEEKEMHLLDWDAHNTAIDQAFADEDYTIAEEQERSRPRSFRIALHENISVAL
jgi:hypothetical protein